MSDSSARMRAVATSHSNRRFALGRRGWLLLAGTIIIAGAAMNWGWLAAVGAAPVFLALAPCAVMCGLGLCMSGGKKSCKSESTNSSNSNGPEKANH